MPTVERYSVENSSKSNASFSSNAHHLALRQHQRMRAHGEALLQVMADHDERAALALLVDQVVDISTACGSSPEYGSSRKHHVGIMDERAGDGQALRHAARERAHYFEAAVFQLHRLQQLEERARSGSTTP